MTTGIKKFGASKHSHVPPTREPRFKSIESTEAAKAGTQQRENVARIKVMVEAAERGTVVKKVRASEKSEKIVISKEIKGGGGLKTAKSQLKR